MKLLSFALISFLSNASAGGYNTRISGYAPGTDVVDHVRISVLLILIARLVSFSGILIFNVVYRFNRGTLIAILLILDRVYI